MQSRARRAESLQITRPTENRGKRRSHTKRRTKKQKVVPPLLRVPPTAIPHKITCGDVCGDPAVPPYKGTHGGGRAPSALAHSLFLVAAPRGNEVMPLAARPPAANYSGAPSAYFSSGARRSHGRRLLRLHLIKPTAYIRTPARSFRLPPVAAPPCQANGAYKNEISATHASQLGDGVMIAESATRAFGQCYPVPDWRPLTCTLSPIGVHEIKSAKEPPLPQTAIFERQTRKQNARRQFLNLPAALPLG